MVGRLGAADGAFRRGFIRAVLQGQRGNADTREQRFIALRRRQVMVLGRGSQRGDGFVHVSCRCVTDSRQASRDPREPAVQHLGRVANARRVAVMLLVARGREHGAPANKVGDAVSPRCKWPEEHERALAVDAEEHEPEHDRPRQCRGGRARRTRR